MCSSCVFCLQVTSLQTLLCSGISPLALFIVQGIRLDKEKCWLSLKLILGLLNRPLSIGGQMTLKSERSCCFYKGNKSTCRKPPFDLTFSHIQKKECTLSFKKVVCHVWQVLIIFIGCLNFIIFWLKKSRPKFLDLFSISEHPFEWKICCKKHF